MRGIVSVLALLGTCAPASAGLYNLYEPHLDPAPGKIRDVVSQLRAAASEPKGRLDPASLRARYLAQAAALEAMQRKDALFLLDRVSLAACYVRLGRTKDAIKLLTDRQLTKDEKDHFMVQANLANAYHREGRLREALLCQQRVLLRWPEMFAGWTREHLDFYKECEECYRDLLNNRYGESERSKKGPFDIDPIFPGFRLPRKGEAYEAGRLPPELMKKLPPKAFGITRQLVLWSPDDQRLYWLMAEMLNASGYVDAAFDIMVSLVDTGLSDEFFAGLFQHRRVLSLSYKAARELRQPSKQCALLSVLLAANPKPTLGAGAVGPAASQAACTATAFWGWAIEFPKLPDLPPEPPPPPAQQLPFNWRHITAGFGFGFVVAMLLGFQWQEWKRRRTRQALMAEPDADLAAPRESSAAIKEHSTSVQPPGH